MPMLHITWASLPDLDNVTFAKDDEPDTKHVIPGQTDQIAA